MKILDEFPVNSMFKPKHPWAEWLDGKVRLLESGKDYQCTDQSIRSGANQKALRMGGNVNISKHKDGLVIQFLPNVEIKPA